MENKLIFEKLKEAGCDISKLDKLTINALSKAENYLSRKTAKKDYQIIDKRDLTYSELMKDISILDLSTRSENALNKACVDKIWKLYILTEHDFMNNIPNFGKNHMMNLMADLINVMDLV